MRRKYVLRAQSLSQTRRSEGRVPKEKVDFASVGVGQIGSVKAGLFVVVMTVLRECNP